MNREHSQARVNKKNSHCFILVNSISKKCWAPWRTEAGHPFLVIPPLHRVQTVESSQVGMETVGPQRHQDKNHTISSVLQPAGTTDADTHTCKCFWFGMAVTWPIQRKNLLFGIMCNTELWETAWHFLLRNICYTTAFFIMEFLLMEFYFYNQTEQMYIKNN